MSCIKTVLIAAGVSFVIILPVLLFSSFTNGVEIGVLVSTVAALAAALSAIFAGCAIWQNGRWQKLNRTYAHSPYRNEHLLNAIDKLKGEYSEMNMTQKEFWKELENNSSTKRTPEKLKEGKVDSVVHVANLWGQMASEYYAGLLDEKIAKEILRTNFMKFCFVFENWLSSGKRMGTYDKTIKLYGDWKSK